MDQNTTTLLVGFITASATLIAVWITNYFNKKQNSERLKNEIKDRNSERKLALRREIYTQSAEALTSMNSHLFSLVTDPNTRSNQQVTSNFFNSINKIILVADSNTALKAKEINFMYIRLFFKITQRVRKLIDIESEISGLDLLVKNYNKEKERLLSLMKEYTENNSTNIRWDNLNDSYKHSDQLAEQYWKDLENCRKLLMDEVAQEIKWIFSQILIIEPHLTELTILLRKELNIETDESFIAAALRERSEELNQLFIQTIEDLSK